MWNRMPKVYPHDFTEEELREGCKRCLEKVRGLLEGAKILNDDLKTHQYALGLYMYAIEEYDNAILLNKVIRGNKKKYQIEGWILGCGDPDPDPITGKKIKAHNQKMMTALDSLPSNCQVLRGVIVTKALPSTKPITIKKGRQGPYDELLLPEGLTGTFVNTSNVNFLDVFDYYNLDLKTACFYMDWHRDNWKYDVGTGPTDLKRSIKCLADALAQDI